MLIDLDERQRFIPLRRRPRPEAHLGTQARNWDGPFTGGFIGHRFPVKRFKTGHVAPGRKSALRGHDEVHQQRSRLHLRHARREVKFQIDAQFRSGRDEKSVAHHGLHAKDAQPPADQRRTVVFKAPHTPRVAARERRHLLNEALDAAGKLLEMLRHQQHSLVPLDSVRNFSHQDVIKLV